MPMHCPLPPPSGIFCAQLRFKPRTCARLAGHPDKVFITAQSGPEVELRRVVAYSPGLIPDSISEWACMCRNGCLLAGGCSMAA